MANIPDVYLLQATRKNLQQAKDFQDAMGANFLEHTMYDIKDAMTSILALCDMEDMKQVPRVKNYIQRVSDLLDDVKLYQMGSRFNINHVLINVINILKSSYKSKLTISHELPVLKARVDSDKSHLEQVLLYLLIEALESTEQSNLSVDIELSQKERDAVIVIKLSDFEYSQIALKEIRSFYREDTFRMTISRADGYTELVIRLPLSFDMMGEELERSKNGVSLKLGEMWLVDSGKKSVSTHKKESRQTIVK